ncbi:MAG: asparagine synthase (glutamine-hydrolyzing) [Oligoflexia bacterium]|nr:asparagine synthase (glutamine-hydrolyzing) [Oligoflexia bacterium]
MCGIFGYISPISANNNINSEKALFNLKHRGPDSSGTLTYGGLQQISLSHRRLSIIDLSTTANQPLERKDLNLVITFNGEIYNYLELKKELLLQGYSFQTNSDTEILLVGYHHYKEGILEKLRGMFAFAIYDNNKNNKNNSIFLARDRVGKKPLYYYLKNNLFIFSSEIKAILCQEGIDKTIDQDALNNYLHFGYISAPLTIYKYIRSLEAAHFMLFKDYTTINIKRYWRIDYRNKIDANSTGINNDLVSQLSNTFEEAVKIRMMAADVPVGAFLSGGIDSSAVVAFASKYTDKLKTFSIKFDYSSFDESQYARMVAQKYKTEHHQFTVDCGVDFLKLLPEIAWHFEQPYADSSALPTYYLSKKTSEHVKVVLSGDGGDESFVGYERYLAHTLSEKYDHLPNVIKILVKKLGEQCWSLEPKTFLFRLKRIIKYLSTKGPFDRYLKTIQYFNSEELPLLFESDLESDNELNFNYQQYFMQILADFDIERIIGFDFERYLPDDLLVKVDRASMAHSLEVRSPFLDHKLVELAASIPMDIKFSRYRLKYLLKNHMLKNVLDKKILFRPKMGFGVPIHDWLKNGMYQYTRQILMDGKFFSDYNHNCNFNKKYIEKLLLEHKDNKANNTNKLWTLLMLGLWYDNQA